MTGRVVLHVVAGLAIIHGLATSTGGWLAWWIVLALADLALNIVNRVYDRRLIDLQREGIRLSDALADAYRRRAGE